MNMKMRKYSNEEYLDFIDLELYLLTTDQEVQKSSPILKRKISDRNVEILERILVYRGLIEAANLTSQIILQKEPDNLEKRNKIATAEDEVKKSLKDFLDSIDSLEFLDWIANTTYELAKIELKRMIDAHSEWLDSAIKWRNYLLNKHKNQSKGKQLKEVLRSVLGNQIDDIEKIKEECKKRIDRVKRGRGNISINLEEEIDLNSATHGDYIIRTMKTFDNQLPAIIRESDDDCIDVGGNEYSLKEYYELKKDEVTKAWLTDTDLLKRILIIYLIKRSRDGDEEAFNKLYSFYEDGTKRQAINFLRYKSRNRNKHGQFSGNLSDQEAESAATRILTTLLKGDGPGNLFRYLEAKPSERKDNMFLNKQPAHILYDSYRNIYETVAKQRFFLEETLANLKRRAKDSKYRAKITPKTETKRRYLDKLFTISQHALGKKTSSLDLFMIINPLDLLGVSFKYNKDLYKPNKKHNLTTWLFGSKKRVKNNKKFPGRLWLALEDWFKGQTSVKDGKRVIDAQDYDPVEFDPSKYEEMEDGSWRQKRKNRL